MALPLKKALLVPFVVWGVLTLGEGWSEQGAYQPLVLPGSYPITDKSPFWSTKKSLICGVSVWLCLYSRRSGSPNPIRVPINRGACEMHDGQWGLRQDGAASENEPRLHPCSWRSLVRHLVDVGIICLVVDPRDVGVFTTLWPCSESCTHVRWRVCVAQPWEAWQEIDEKQDDGGAAHDCCWCLSPSFRGTWRLQVIWTKVKRRPAPDDLPTTQLRCQLRSSQSTWQMSTDQEKRAEVLWSPGHFYSILAGCDQPLQL